MNSLIIFFCSLIELTNEEIDFVQKNCCVCNYEKNHLLLQKGQISHEFYFVIKGCIRLYYLIETNDKTAYFYTENMFVSSFLSFTQQSPARHNIETIEESTLVVFNSKSVEKFIEFSPRFGILAKIMMEEELIAYQQIVSSFVTQNAEERYEDLLKK